jgi:hypothetical protein
MAITDRWRGFFFACAMTHDCRVRFPFASSGGNCAWASDGVGKPGPPHGREREVKERIAKGEGVGGYTKLMSHD